MASIIIQAVTVFFALAVLRWLLGDNPRFRSTGVLDVCFFGYAIYAYVALAQAIWPVSSLWLRALLSLGLACTFLCGIATMFERNSFRVLFRGN